MTRPLIGILVGLVVVVAVLTVGLSLQASFDAEKQSMPPRRERPTAGVDIGPNDIPDVLGAQVAVLEAFYQEQDRIDRERIEAEAAAAEAARVAASRPAPGSTPVSGGAQPTTCDGHVIPGDILAHESGCDYGAVNPGGCGGNGCVGLYQFDTRHFNPGGACADLDWHSPADQDECARRLSNGGTNLAPWGR